MLCPAKILGKVKPILRSCSAHLLWSAAAFPRSGIAAAVVQHSRSSLAASRQTDSTNRIKEARRA